MVRALHSVRRRDMGAQFHSSNTIMRKAADTFKSFDSQKNKSVLI